MGDRPLQTIFKGVVPEAGRTGSGARLVGIYQDIYHGGESRIREESIYYRELTESERLAWNIGVQVIRVLEQRMRQKEDTAFHGDTE